MKSIAVMNLVGGVAKTTSAVNLGYILATTYNKRVLLCDMDFSGDLSSTYGLWNETDAETSVTELLANPDTDPYACIRKTAYKNVSVIPGNVTLNNLFYNPDFCTNASAEGNRDLLRLRHQLDKVDADFDYCIIDCSTAQTFFTYSILACVDELIIPTALQFTAYKAMQRLARLVEGITQSVNPKLRIAGMYYSRIEMNNNLLKECTARSSELIPANIPQFKTFIRHNVDAIRAGFALVPLSEYYARTKDGGVTLKSGQDFENLVAEYLGLPFPYPVAPYAKNA